MFYQQFVHFLNGILYKIFLAWCERIEISITVSVECLQLFIQYTTDILFAVLVIQKL